MIATRAKVVDASAVAAMLFAEPEAEAIAARLVGVQVLAPALIEYEVANACLKKLRKFPDRRSELLAGFAEWTNFGIELNTVHRYGVLRLAEETGLTAYDANYLWLARERDADLVTLDRRLAAFAPSPGTP